MSSSSIRHYQPGDIIFEEGSEGTECFIVLSGRVGIFKAGDGPQKILHELGSGEFFGELALINATRRAASTMALEADTSVIGVDRARFLYLVSQQPAFALMVMETISRWLLVKPPTVAGAQQGRTPPQGPAYRVVPVDEGVWQLRSRSRSCNCYLLRGRDRIVLVDAGLGSAFGDLSACLAEIGVSPEMIDTIVLTHEHFDHVAAVPHFQGRPSVAAHKLAAHKLANRDEFAIMTSGFGEPSTFFTADNILDGGSLVDTGSHRLRVLHTPGHTSGCISLFDESRGLLFTGDMVLAGGYIGGVFGSGNVSDCIHSLETLQTLKARRHLPGHGQLSDEPARDLVVALEKLHTLLRESRFIFESLNSGDNVKKLILSVRDLNR